jgi:uncharacterized membrane protein
MDKQRLNAIGLALLVLILMSVDNVFIKIAIEEISPFSYVWISLIIGMIALSAYTFLIRKEKIPRPLMTKKSGFLSFRSDSLISLPAA